ncbi:MAG: hypothetical protein U0996_11685 [Planctomycetaceae bacterium]
MPPVEPVAVVMIPASSTTSAVPSGQTSKCCSFRASLTGSLLPFLAILTLALSVLTTSCADPDLWGHIQYGREVLRDGVLPTQATWTFAAEEAPWVNHENIAELLLAFAFDTFGSAGLIATKLALAVLLLSLMLYAARASNASWSAAAIVVILVCANMQFHWHFRPQILTYVSLAIILAIWRKTFGDFRLQDARIRKHLIRHQAWLWCLPPVLCFWTNSHGGFAAGLAILSAAHGLACLQILVSTGLRHRTLLINITLVTIACFGASLVNPYGTGLWKFMLDALLLPRPEISDWGRLELFTAESVRFWALLFVGIIAFGSSARQRWIQATIMALLLWQGLSHCRHLSIFAVVCGFWIPGPFTERIRLFLHRLSKVEPQAPSVQSRSFSTAAILMLLIVLSTARLGTKLASVDVDRNEFPVAAMQFLHDHGLTGRTVVTFNWAQYAIGCFANDPETFCNSRVAVDGRFETCYPREITDIYFDFWMGTPDSRVRYRSPKSGPFDPAKALTFRDPDLILLCRHQLPSVRIMETHAAQWTLLYQDSLAQIWGRTSRYGEPGASDFVPPEDRRITDEVQEGNVAYPAYPTPYDQLDKSENARSTRTESPADRI